MAWTWRRVFALAGAHDRLGWSTTTMSGGICLREPMNVPRRRPERQVSLYAADPRPRPRRLCFIPFVQAVSGLTCSSCQLPELLKHAESTSRDCCRSLVDQRGAYTSGLCLRHAWTFARDRQARCLPAIQIPIRYSRASPTQTLCLRG